MTNKTTCMQRHFLRWHIQLTILLEIEIVGGSLHPIHSAPWLLLLYYITSYLRSILIFTWICYVGWMDQLIWKVLNSLSFSQNYWWKNTIAIFFNTRFVKRSRRKKWQTHEPLKGYLVKSQIGHQKNYGKKICDINLILERLIFISY